MQSKPIYLTFCAGAILLSLFGSYAIPRLEASNSQEVSPLAAAASNGAVAKGYIKQGHDVDEASLSKMLPPPPLDALPYEVRTPLSNGWSVPVKKRWIWLPEDTQIAVKQLPDGTLNVTVPTGTKWWKEFYLETDKGVSLIERRIVLKTPTGWQFYTAHYQPDGTDNKITVHSGSGEAQRYLFQADEWLPTQSIATSLEVDFQDDRGKVYPYMFPGQTLCSACHVGAAGAYPNKSDDPDTAISAFGFHPNNLTPESYKALVERGWIIGGDLLLTQGYPLSETHVAPAGTEQQSDADSKTQQVVAVLRNNCLSCHNASNNAMGRTTGFILDPNKDYTTQELVTALNVKGKMFGDETNFIVTPGDPDHSEIMLRLMGLDGRRRMPPAEGGLPQPNDHFIDLVRSWILAVGPN